MSIDHAKIRRESMRWQLIAYLNKARPMTTHESRLLDTMQVIFGADATPMEIRRELDYLADRKLVQLVKEPSGTWYADLTRWGIDLAEYTVDCDPGIARPVKYWAE
ncbi:MAG: hypothetical protein PHY45_11750 [Rhodocyclaceae bacterium]|nr:hypothetical protein [Rhodocyclaceae bacterium]